MKNATYRLLVHRWGNRVSTAARAVWIALVVWGALVVLRHRRVREAAALDAAQDEDRAPDGTPLEHYAG